MDLGIDIHMPVHRFRAPSSSRQEQHRSPPLALLLLSGPADA